MFRQWYVLINLSWDISDGFNRVDVSHFPSLTWIPLWHIYTHTHTHTLIYIHIFKISHNPHRVNLGKNCELRCGTVNNLLICHNITQEHASEKITDQCILPEITLRCLIVFGFGRVYVCLMNVSVLYPYRLHLHYAWMSAVSTSALMDRWCCIIPLSTADTTSASHSAACWVHRSRSTQTPAAHCGSAHVRHAHRALSFALDGRCLYLCYFSSSYILLQHLFIF